MTRNQINQARYYQRHKSACRARSKAWWAAHPGARIRLQQAWREKNREKARAYCSKWRKSHAAEKRRHARLYAKRHPARVNALNHIRRTRKKGAGGRWRAGDIEQLLLAQDGLCALCWRPLDANYHVDHILPISKGGSNYPSNLQVTHATCNLRKHNRAT